MQDGTDGHELTDYDLVGSRRAGTGIFALEPLSRLDLLYLPPPGKNRDLGPASLLAAELFCRERSAMLIVDPRSDWVTPAKAIAGVRGLGLASPNAMTYFPRMYNRDGDGAARAIRALEHRHVQPRLVEQPCDPQAAETGSDHRDPGLPRVVHRLLDFRRRRDPALPGACLRV